MPRSAISASTASRPARPARSTTGASSEAAYSIEDQFGWNELPAQDDLGEDAAGAEQAVEDDVEKILAQAHAGLGGKAVAPASASKPAINVYRRDKPAIATVQGNFRITAPGTESDIRHIVLSFGSTVVSVLEGQSIGIVPPGTSPDGKPHNIRLYSIASARDGEKRNANNVSLTIKRVEGGVGSNYMCDLKVGDKVEVTGPFGATFLMPNDTQANLIMICTGTGSAPFRAFTERRRRAMQNAAGKAMMFFGARTPQELPYFGPLQKVPNALLEKHLVFSRIPGADKEYVQDRMRTEGKAVADILKSPATHMYICGLKDMETGVDEALADICRKHGLRLGQAQARNAGEREVPCRDVLKSGTRESAGYCARLPVRFWPIASIKGGHICRRHPPGRRQAVSITRPST